MSSDAGIGGGGEDGGAEVSSGCSRAISGENAQALYAKIKDREGADHCKLEEVRTAGDVMRVEWKKDGALVPAAEIRPRECSQGGLVTGPEFSLSAPAETLSRCPDAIAALKTLVGSERFGGTVQLDAQAGYTIPLVIAGGVLLLLAIALVLARKRRQ